MTWATIIERASSINHWSVDDRARLDALRRQVATKLRAYRRKHRLTPRSPFAPDWGEHPIAPSNKATTFTPMRRLCPYQTLAARFSSYGAGRYSRAGPPHAIRTIDLAGPYQAQPSRFSSASAGRCIACAGPPFCILRVESRSPFARNGIATRSFWGARYVGDGGQSVRCAAGWARVATDQTIESGRGA